MEQSDAPGFDPSMFDNAAQGGDNYTLKDDDRGVSALFFLQAVLQGFKSHEAKREIYEDKVFVRIRVKGNDKTEVIREAHDADKRRFPHQYKAFLDGAEQVKTGTPLERLPGVTPSMALMLRNLHIRTIEDLSEIGDNVLPNVGMGGRELRTRAVDYLTNGKATQTAAAENIDRLTALCEKQNEALSKATSTVETQQAEIDALREQVKALGTMPVGARPRGRPRKVA